MLFCMCYKRAYICPYLEYIKLNAASLEQGLRRMDKQGVWLLSRAQFRVLFPDESTDTLKKSLARHVKASRLLRVAYGLYANPVARSLGAYPLEAIVSRLRPLDFNYLSAETVLAESGVISQMTQNYLTIMTTGSSKCYTTPFGTVEFTHSKRDHRAQMDQLWYDEQRGLWVASIALAYRDLKRLGRNTGLVDSEALKDALLEAGQAA